MAHIEGPAAGDEAVRGGSGGESAECGPVGYEPGPQVQELRRRAAARRAAIARGEPAPDPGLADADSMTGYPALAAEVHANAHAIAAQQALLDEILEVMSEVVNVRAPSPTRRPHLRLVREGEKDAG